MPPKGNKDKKEKGGSGASECGQGTSDAGKGCLPEKIRYGNAVCCYEKFRRGAGDRAELRRLGEFLVARRIKQYRVWHIESGFERRVTSITWHPTRSNVLAVGSKGGEMLLTEITNSDKESSFHCGIGPGGSIMAIAFDPDYKDHGYTASLDGTVKKWDFDRNSSKTLLETASFEKWYCSVSLAPHTKTVVAGDTCGDITLLDSDDKVVSKQRIHKNKVSTAEFCKKRGWLLATASIDRTVKLWDVRKLRDNAPLVVLPHDRPVNSAFFSSTDSNRILTTDQHSQLRIYKAPFWELEHKIMHPHRQFQHLTAIKAVWHPLCDLAVVGRYPDPDFPGYVPGEIRTIDVFSAETGELMTQLFSPSCKGIMSLNVFNSSGEYLATGMGLYIPLWKWESPRERRDSVRKRRVDEGPGDDGGEDRPVPFRPPKNRSKQTKAPAKSRNQKNL